MKKYYLVSFKYSENTYCTNIAHAETTDAVRARYSKYEWVNVEECGENEVATAKRKSMPIVEIESKQEDENMQEFTEIKKEVTQDSETRKNNTAFYIENGFMPSWAEEHHNEPDRGLTEYSTETRWNQYRVGQITREKATELAITRATKAIEKETAAELAKLDEVATAADLNHISVSVGWVRSQTWGYNPRVEVRTNPGFFTGSASGCGYDKESAAIADAFNKCNSILKALYTLKEKGLRAGQSDKSKTASCGRSNGSICGYGAGYGAIPYFEGGVGSSCFWEILKKCGYIVRENHSKHSDFYSVEKEVAQ
jgi:hypothetical protein